MGCGVARLREAAVALEAVPAEAHAARTPGEDAHLFDLALADVRDVDVPADRVDAELPRVAEP